MNSRSAIVYERIDFANLSIAPVRSYSSRLSPKACRSFIASNGTILEGTPENIRKVIDLASSRIIAALPNPSALSADESRGIIARYGAVLEGNFIAWMTAALLSTSTPIARSIIRDNITEELKENHPGMLRRFLLAADALPTENDFSDTHAELEKVRNFIGELSPVRIIVMMAMFENFISKFMSFLASLARSRNSTDLQYTDVHGECDVAHTEGLHRVIEAELAGLDYFPSDLFEGAELLTGLLYAII